MSTVSPEPTPPDAPLDDGPSLVAILLRRSWLMALGALAGLGLGYLYITWIPPRFVSTGHLLVIRKRPDMVPGMERPGSVAEDHISTQAGIIKSPLIVGRAVKDANLATLMSFQSSEDVTASVIPALSVKRDLKDRANSILELSFKGLEPHDCQKVLDAVIKAYRKFLQEDYRKRSEETLKLIVAAKEMLEKSLARKEAEYVEFRRKNPALRMKGKVAENIYNEMLLNLHAKRLSLRIRRAEIEALLKSIDKTGKKDKGHEQLIALICQMSNRSVSESGGRSQSAALEEKLLPALIEQQTLLAEYAPTHPLVIAASKRVELAHKVVTSVLELDLAAAKTAEQSMADLYQTQEEEAQKLVGAEVEDEVRRNDIVRLQQLSDSTIKRLQEIDVVKDLGGYDADVIGPPSVGKLASQSNPTMIFPLSAALGLVAGAGLGLAIPLARRNPAGKRVTSRGTP